MRGELEEWSIARRSLADGQGIKHRHLGINLVPKGRDNFAILVQALRLKCSKSTDVLDARCFVLIVLIEPVNVR